METLILIGWWVASIYFLIGSAIALYLWIDDSICTFKNYWSFKCGYPHPQYIGFSIWSIYWSNHRTAKFTYWFFGLTGAIVFAVLVGICWLYHLIVIVKELGLYQDFKKLLKKV
ncbi:MAG: hypothetical protein NT162_00515 [Candidatus Woesebacteria bacterium]|nr:hypothetical protein [Candidatus Woesebacteria bacterium]